MCWAHQQNFPFSNSNKKLCFQSDQKMWSINVKTSNAICVHRRIWYKHFALAAMMRAHLLSRKFSALIFFTHLVFSHPVLLIYRFIPSLFFFPCTRSSLDLWQLQVSSSFPIFFVEKFLIEKLMLWRDIRGLKSACGNWKLLTSIVLTLRKNKKKNPHQISFASMPLICATSIASIQSHPSQKLLFFD